MRADCWSFGGCAGCAPLIADLFYTATGGGGSLILLAMTVGLKLSRLLVRLLGASMAFWTLAVLVLKAWSVNESTMSRLLRVLYQMSGDRQM